MNKTAKKEVESSLNYLNTGLLLAFSLLFFLIILAYPVDALTWPTRTLNCEDTTGDDGGSIDCNWNITDLDSTATGFSLWRKATSNWVTIHSTLKVIDTTFTDVNAQTGTNYKYRLLLFNGTIEDDTWGDESGYTMAQDNNIPTPPNNIIAVDTQNDQGGSISISWDPSDSEAGGSGDNFVKGFRINYNCSSPSIVNENKSLGKIYEWPHEYDITPPRSYGNCTYSMSSYDAGENGSGIRYGGWSSVTEAVNGTDNLPPQPPTGAAAGDILGDDGKLGININWTRSVDEIEVESGADDIQGYYVIAMTAESGQNWTNIIIDGPVAATVASIIGSETTPFDTSVNNNLTIMYTNGDGDAEICNVEFTQNFSYATVTGDSLGGFDFTLNNTLNLTYTNNTVEESCSVEFVGVTMSTTVTASSIRAVCNITATNSSGYLKLETKNIGSDEFINLTGGNATNMLGFQINNKYYGNNGFTIEDAISNITGSPGNCDLYATKVDGKLKLTTKTLGAETFIIISGTATSVFGLDTNVHEGTDAYTSPGYLVAKGGPYSISFQNGSNGITIGSSSSPWNVNSYFNTTLFYFYIKSYDGTFNSTGTSIVSAAFNGRPYIKALDLDPLKGFTQTEDNIVCTAFVCDPNNDEVTSKYKFTVAAFAGGGNYEEEGDATCINMGPISGNSTIQKNYGKDIGCNPGIVEIPDSWECMAVLPNTFTFKGNKITCAQTPNDGKEEGDTLDNTMNDPDNITHPYPINNTAPIASNAYIYPPAPLGNDTLTCKYTYSDIDLDSESNDSINEKTTAFKWYINNEGLNTFVEIPDKTSKTLDEYFDQNDKVMCSINVCDYDGSWLKNSLCYNERSWFNESGVADTVEATAAYIIGSKTTTFDTNPNNALSITHTNSTGGSEICTVTLSTNNTLTITEAINNITGSPGNCDLAATSVDGKLKLTTKTSGAGTFIIISGTATSEFGFDTIVHGGTDAYDLLGAWTWLTGTSYYEYENSTTTIIGGNSIPQLISYSDDSNATLPTDVGSQVTFNATWLDTDANELARIMVCEKEGEPDDYDCDGQNCTGSIDFGDNGNNAWIYTNQTGLMIDTIEIKIKSFTLNGTTNSVENATTPFIFSIIAYEADNITSTLPPTSTVPDYYEAQTMRIARSDWNSLTNNQWITLTLQYNAQPLSDKYTALKFCIATEQDGIAGSDLGGTGYVISNIEQNTNWFNSMINWFGKIFRSLFKITGYAATSYVDTCFEAGDFYKNRTGGTSASVGALNNTETRDIAYDNSRWYDYVNIRINYKSVGINGSCPGDKTYCETEFSPEIDQSCSYTPTDSDNTTVKYNIRVCDDELACSIWRYGYFSVNHPAKLDWVTIGTNYLSYEEGLTYSSDVNDDWNLQCIQGTASDKDLANTITSDIIIDADGWTTVFADIQNEKDPNLENGTSLIECSSDTKLRWIDVNDGDGDYDYEIDTLIHTTGGVILQFSNVSGGTGNIFSSSSTEATVTGTIKGPFNTSSNNILKLGYTVNGVTYSCDVTLNQSDSTSTDTIVTNITTQCTGGGGITATNSTGYLKLTTTGTGSDEHIDIRSGNAIGTLGFETGKTYGTDASNCYFHDKNNDGNYDSGEDIIWDETAFNSVFDENINFTYQWFVKPFGDTEFKSCDDFLWCDNDYNDILTHGNTMPGDRWLCQMSPTDWRDRGVKENSTIVHVTGATGEETAEEAGGPSIDQIIDNSNNLTPININDNVTVNVTWSGPFDFVKLYICDNDTHIRNSGCWGYEFDRTVTMDNPAQATFKVDEFAVQPGSSTPIFNGTNHSPIEYKVLLCNADYECSNSSINTFFVNHIPEVTAVNLMHYNLSSGNYTNGTTAKNSETLNCTNIVYNDPDTTDNSSLKFTYRWWLLRLGYWQIYWEQGPTSNTSGLLSFSATQLGDQWKCEVTPNDAYSAGTSKESSIVTISESDVTSGIVTVINVTDNSNYTSPTNTGNNVTFIIDWASPNTTSVIAYICNETGILNTGCRAESKTFGFSDWTTSNPISLTYTIDTGDYGASITEPVIQYHTMVCNENYECSDVFNKSYTNFGSNHIPEARNVTLKNSAGGGTINENSSINCSYTFFDLDSQGDNALSYNASNFYTESNSYFSWYKKIQGIWVKQSYNLQILASQYTVYGDQWKCEVKVNDGYVNSTPKESPGRTVGSNAPAIDSLIHNSNSTNPVTFNENLDFTIDWFDAQQEEGGLIQLFVCNSSSTTAGCSDTTTYCEVSFTDSDPISCSFNTSTFFNSTGNATNFTYNVSIYDEDGNFSFQDGTMYVNRKPTIDEVNLTKTGGGDNPTQNDNLVCSPDSNDYDNSSLTNYTYTWYLDTGYGFAEYTYPNNETLTSSQTSIGQRWKCSVKINDGFIDSDSMNSNNVTITQYGVNSTPTILSFSSNSNLTNPTNVGSDVTFTINWTDAEQVFGESVQVYVCNNDNIIENGGCVNKSFSFTDFTSENPVYATYTVLETDNGTINFTIMVCDDSNLCSTTNSSNFSVNQIPTAQNTAVINSTNGSFFNTSYALNCNYTFNDNDDNTSNTSIYWNESATYFYWYKLFNNSWQTQSIATSVQNLSSDYTINGESWKCGVIVNDGYANSTETISESIAIGNVDPVINSVTLNSNSTNPLQYGENAEFIIDWSDANTNEVLDIFVCNSSSHNREGCLNTAFCTLDSTSTSPFSCLYNSSNIDTNSTNVTFYVYAYDSTDKEVNDTGNFYINHLPTISSVDLNTTDGSIWPTVTDDLNCSAINVSDQDDDNGMFNGTDVIYNWYFDQGNNFTSYDYNGKILTAWHTLAGDYWYCTITPTDGFHDGTPITSNTIYVYDLSINDTAPTIVNVSVNSNLSNPTNVGNNITFTINWNDADLPFGQTVTAYICDSSGRWLNGSCKNPYTEITNVSSTPLITTYTTLDTDDSTSNFTIQLVDETGKESNTVSDYFAVNHNPNATSVETIQLTKDTLQCNFTYNPSIFLTSRNDSEINDNQSDDNSEFKWYVYQNNVFTEILGGIILNGRNMTATFEGGEIIMCAVKVGDIWSLTDTEFRNSTNNITIAPPPSAPTIWPLGITTNKNTSQIIGHLYEDNISNISVESWGWKGYETPNNTTNQSLQSSTLWGTSTVIDTFEENSSFVVISNTDYEKFNSSAWILFANHDMDFFLRYNITEIITIIPDEQYRLNMEPNLTTSVPNETIVYAYNSKYPHGWFNITLDLFSGNNTIKSRAIKTITHGTLTGAFSTQQTTFSDSEAPTIDTSEIDSPLSTPTPTIYFNISDNYGLNLSSLLLNISGGNNDIFHRVDDTIYNDSSWTFGQDISCSSINSTSERCNVTLNLTDNEAYSIKFTVNDTLNNNGSNTKSGFKINTSVPSTPSVTRNQAEFNNTNLTFNVSINTNITGGILQYAIGTEVYPNDGWNSIIGWENLTNLTTGAQNISYSNISDSWTNLTIYTGNSSLTPHNIYIANVRYQLYNWSLWSDVGSSLAMKYFPPFAAGDPPSSVNVTAPIYSFSQSISVTWTQSTDDKYTIDYYLIAAGTEEYPNSGWNTTTDGWINAGDSLGKTLDLTENLTHLETYYFTVTAVNTINVNSTPTSSFGTTYYDQTPPVASIFSVSNDTDASDGWLDYIEDNQTLINITGDENMTCYYSLYDQDYADIDSSKGDSYCNTTGTSTDLNLTCNVTHTNGTYLSQNTYTYYIICQDTLQPTENQQNSSENTEVIFTVNWPDEPELDNITIDITDYTDESNNRNVSNLTYALTDDLLLCNYTASDLDGNETVDDSLTQYIWYLNIVEISGQTTANLNLSVTGSAGDNITCAVNITDTTGLSSGFINNTDFTLLVFINNSIPTKSILSDPENASFHTQTIEFNWTDSIDADEDSINYTLYIDNSTSQEYSTAITDSNYTLNISNTTDWLDGNYSWYITTCDNSSFADRCINSTNNLTFRIDQTAPEINITSPENNATVGILVEFYVDINDTLNDIDATWYTIVNSTDDTIANGLTGTPFVLLNNSYYFAWSTSAFTTGNYTFFAHTNDTLGNYNNESINFTLDLLEPYMEIDTDPWQFRGQWLRDTLFIRVFINSTNSTFGANYTVTANYTISHQNGTVIKTNSTTNSSASFEWNNTYYVNTSEWPDARYDAVFKSTDTLNNTETIETWFVVDKTPPTYANPTVSPSPTYDYDNVTLSINWINNVFIWDANENNIDKESVKIIYTYNTSNTNEYEEINLSSGLSFLDDTFSGTINSDYTNKSKTIFWKSLAYDLAGNLNDSANSSNNSSEWFNFTIYSTPPVFNQTIQDTSWPEDTNYTNLTLNPSYFYDPDNDNLTYNYTMYPRGILLYDNLDNLTETTNYNDGSYENINTDDGIDGYSILLESAIMNLILNGDFENSTQDAEQITIPKEWTRYSHPDYQHNAPPRYVIINEHNYYSQIINVTENENYTLSLYMVTNSSSGTGRLHINWFNELYFTDNTTNKTLSFLGSTLDCQNSENCSGLIDLDNTTLLNDSASKRILTLTSPLDSTYAQIIVDSDSNNTWVKVDKVQFEQKEYASAFYDGQRQPGSLSYPIATSYSNYSRNNFNKEQGTIEMFVKPLWDGNDTLNEDATFFNIRLDSSIGEGTTASLTSTNTWPFVFTVETNATSASITGTTQGPFNITLGDNTTTGNNIFKVQSSDINYTINLSENNLTKDITIQNLSSSPQNLSIELGTNVTWTNIDTGVTHNISIVGPESTSSNDLVFNGSFSYVFATEGDYNYSSVTHPEVNGTITVFNKTDNRTLTAADVTHLLNLVVIGITASDSNGSIKLETTDTSSTADIKILNGTANSLLGFTENQESTGEAATTDTTFFEATIDSQSFNITFNATEYSITEVVNLINSKISDTASSSSSGELVLTSLTSGEDSMILIGEGTANFILGLEDNQESQGIEAIDDIFWLGRKGNNLEFGVIERNWTVTHNLINWSNDEWKFIAVTWKDNGSISLTIDNETTTNSGPISFSSISGEDFNSLTMYVGSDAATSKQANAYIDELAIYDYRRSSTDLLNDYNQNTTISFTESITTNINQTEGNTTFSPTSDFFGEHRIRFFVNDSFTKVASNMVNLNVTPVNDAPTSSTIPNQSWFMNQSNYDALFLEDYFNDIDSQTLTYTINHTDTSASTDINITPVAKAKELLSSTWILTDTTDNASFDETTVMITEANAGNITLYQDISENRTNTTYTFSVTHTATNTNISEINYSVIIQELNSTEGILETTIFDLTGELTTLTQAYTTSTNNLTTIRVTLQQNPLVNNVTANSTWTNPSFTLSGNWVSFTQPENFTGTEIIYFNISDGENYTLSNNITLEVYLNILFNTYIDGIYYSETNHNNTLIEIYQSELYNSNITGTGIIETNATITGNETGPFNTTVNYVLDLTYTNNSIEESCSVTLDQGGSTSTGTIVTNITSSCNITATNNSGYLKLTTFGVGIDEYITITGGNATSELGLITGARYNGTSFSRTEIKSSFLNYTNLTNSNATDSSINLSKIINSTLDDCDVRNSLVKNYNASNCIITDSEVDPVNITRNLLNSNVTNNSNVFDTELINSTVINSTINASIITTSTINNTVNLFNSTITNSIILNSNISDVTLTDTTVDSSTIDPSNVTNSTITGSSTVLNSNITDSTINNSNVSMSWILGITLVNANVTNNIIYAGLVYNSAGSLIYNFSESSQTNSLANITNYPPHITSFNFSQEGTDNPKVQADIEDENLGGAISDNLTYTINWGDSSSTTGNITSSGEGFEVDRNHEYSSSGNYTATLTVTDSFGETDTESGNLTLTETVSEGGTTCYDGIQNQGETGVDCGGPCSSCNSGGGSGTPSPPTPTCTDEILNQDETGIDCGGVCAACPSSATCSDGILNQDETGIDCGGSCSACPAATCYDGIQNQDEEDVDCGGQSCAPCTVAATCYDNIQNQGESGTDCGGPCTLCATCFDSVQNQGEEDIDCGGPCSTCIGEEQPAVFGIPLNYMPYIFGSFIALVAIIGLLLRLRSKPPKKPETEIKPLPKLTPIEKPIPPPQEEKPIKAIKPKAEDDQFTNLKEYIKIRLSHGFDKEHIKQALLIKGWPEEVLDVALDGSKELESKLNDVDEYIKSSSAEGYSLENIRDSLLEQGWSEGITDLILFSCHKPHKNNDQLKGYINYKLAQGKKPDEIKQILTSIGWNEEVINSVL